MCTICSFFCTYAHPHKLLFTNLLFSRIIIFSIIYILVYQNPKFRRKRGCRYCDAKYLREKMQTVKNIISKWNSISLVKRIICGLIIGIILGLVVPQASGISILGDLFVGALRGIAPVLVFFLVMSSLCHMGKGQKTNMKVIVILYMAGNILAAACAVAAS